MKRSSKIILPIVVLLGAGVLTAVMITNRPRVQPEPREVPVPLVRVVALESQPYQFTVRAQGAVLPQIDIQLSTEVAGRVQAISPHFAAGGFFETGEILVQIDRSDFELAVTRARATLAEAGVRLQREEAEAEVARREWESLGQGKPTALVLREPQLADARAAIESAKANLQQAELNLARSAIRAPFAGRVWEKNADVGQFIPQGGVVGRIYAVEYAEVRLPLPLDEAQFLDLPMEYRGEKRPADGPRVTLRARFGSQTHEWQGAIVRTEGEIDPRTRMLTAVARVNNPYGRGSDHARPPLSVGLFVDAEIEGKPAGEVFLAPRAAMRGEQHLMIVDAERRLRFRPVEILRREREQVVIRAGVQAGELVCVSPLDAPVDGMKVRVANATEPVARVNDGAAHKETP